MRLLLTLLIVMCANVVSAQSKRITEEQVYEAFDASKGMYEGGDKSCASVNILIGDLNGDGFQDGLVHFVCGPKGGNAVLALGWVIFINDNGKLKFWLIDEPFKGVPKKIRANGVIDVDKFEYRANDKSCCPSIKIPKRYRLRGKTLVKFT